MMKVIINDTIETFWESLLIKGMQSPERQLINQCAVPQYVVLGEGKNKCAIRRDGEIEYIEGDAGVLEATIYGENEDLVKLLLFHVGEIICKCDNGMIFKGVIKEFSATEGVSGAVKVTMQLYRL
jgi:hypothetical protein